MDQAQKGDPDNQRENGKRPSRNVAPFDVDAARDGQRDACEPDAEHQCNLELRATREPAPHRTPGDPRRQHCHLSREHGRESVHDGRREHRADHQSGKRIAAARRRRESR